MLDNKKMMLAYGLDNEQLEALRMSNLEVKEVTTEMASMKIGQIIEGLKFEIHDKKVPEEKIVLFNSFSDEELDKAIKLVRAIIGREGILAVVTPTSINWTFHYLIEHLMEEREWFKNNRK